MAANEVMVLLMLEAVDKASQILEGVSGKLDAMGEAAQAAADKAALTGDELEAAQVKAEAAANAYTAAVGEQEAAQAGLLESTTAVREAQEAASGAAAQLAEATAAGADTSSESYARIAAAADESAAAVKVAVAEQITALDALNAAQAETAARSEESAAAQDAISTESDASGSKLAGLAGIAIGTAAAVAGIGYESIKAAANFQSATSVLVTSGGETAANIGMVRQGILSLAASTGTATGDLTKGMYMIGSAGYTGAQGLTVLKAAAQGAKAEGADLGTVGNALTTVMKDYHQTASSAVPDMNEMIAVVQNGKTTTEALASSLSAVLPTAAAAGLSFAQVGGAIATMTGEGVSAQQAAQDLSNTISALQKPNATAVTEMQSLGLSSNQVSQDLGKKGLTGTMQELTQAIASHTQGGQVLISTYQNATQAAADANAEIKAMPSSLQGLAQQFLNGSVTAKQWKADLQGLSPTQSALMGQFATTAEKADSFNQYLKSGAPAAQTYNGAMSTMLNGVTGLHTALAISGQNMGTFQANVKSVGAAGKNAGTNVAGWSTIQGTMNQKLDELKETTGAAAIQLGTALLPMVSKILDVVMKVVTPIANWIEKNKTLAAGLLLLVGGLATAITVIVGVGKVVKTTKEAFDTLSEVGDAVEKGFKTGINTLNGVGSALSSAASSAAEFGSNALSAAGQFASSAWSTVTGTLSSMGTAIAEAATATWNWVASAAAAAASATKEAIAWTADKIELLATTVVEKAAAAAQFLLDAAMDANPITLIVIAIAALVAAFVLLWTHSAAFRDFWIGLWHDIESVTMTVVDAVVGFFEGLYHDASALVGDVVGFVEGHWRLLLTILTGPIGLAVSLITKYWSDIKHWFQGGVNGVESILSWFTSLPGKFTQWLGSVVTAVSQKIGDVTKWFSNLPTDIQNMLSDAGTWLYDIGKSIIDGLISGIKSAFGDVKSALSELTSWIPSWKGPSSYDAVMLTGNGQLIMKGLITGIDSQTDALHAKLGQITTSIKADMTGPQNLGQAFATGLGGAASTGSAASGNTYITVEGGNTLMSDSDFDKFAQKVGQRVVQSIGPQGGVKTLLR